MKSSSRCLGSFKISRTLLRKKTEVNNEFHCPSIPHESQIVIAPSCSESNVHHLAPPLPQRDTVPLPLKILLNSFSPPIFAPKRPQEELYTRCQAEKWLKSLMIWFLGPGQSCSTLFTAKGRITVFAHHIFRQPKLSIYQARNPALDLLQHPKRRVQTRLATSYIHHAVPWGHRGPRRGRWGVNFNLRQQKVKPGALGKYRNVAMSAWGSSLPHIISPRQCWKKRSTNITWIYIFTYQSHWFHMKCFHHPSSKKQKPDGDLAIILRREVLWILRVETHKEPQNFDEFQAEAAEAQIAGSFYGRTVGIQAACKLHGKTWHPVQWPPEPLRLPTHWDHAGHLSSPGATHMATGRRPKARWPKNMGAEARAVATFLWWDPVLSV